MSDFLTFKQYVEAIGKIAEAEQKPGLDEFDKEAEKEGQAIKHINKRRPKELKQVMRDLGNKKVEDK